MSFLYYLDHPGRLGVIDRGRGVMSDVVRASAEGTQLAALAWGATTTLLPLSQHWHGAPP